MVSLFGSPFKQSPEHGLPKTKKTNESDSNRRLQKNHGCLPSGMTQGVRNETNKKTTNVQALASSARRRFSARSRESSSCSYRRKGRPGLEEVEEAATSDPELGTKSAWEWFHLTCWRKTTRREKRRTKTVQEGRNNPIC